MTFSHKKVTELSADEKRDITELWQQAFGDTRDFISFMLGGTLHDAQFFAATENDVLCSMFFIMDIECKADSFLKVAYIYAVATEKRFRGKGIFPSLFSFAATLLKKSGAELVLCKPSTPELYRYYKKLGFENVCFSGTVQIKQKKNGYNFTKTAFSEELYEIYLKNIDVTVDNLVKTRAQLETSLECAADTDYKIFEFESGFMLADADCNHIKYICAPKGKEICIAESFADFLGADITVTLYDTTERNGYLPYASALFFDREIHGIYCPLLFE